MAEAFNIQPKFLSSRGDSALVAVDRLLFAQKIVAGSLWQSSANRPN